MENQEKTANEVKKEEGVYKYTFKRPYTYEGKEYKEMTFRFRDLKGEDMIDIENEMQAMSEYALAPEISASFLSKLAAKAAKVGSDVITNLPIGEFAKIKNAARDFLVSQA
ncbi:MAG: phage tail assembly protein [Acidaminococcaceae bacterium]